MLRVQTADFRVGDIIYTHGVMQCRVTAVTPRGFTIAYRDEGVKECEYGFSCVEYTIIRPSLILADLAGVVHG
jgi:hypothetical protein